MAIYKEAGYLEYLDVEEFNRESRPGTPTSVSGIYRCMGCSREIVSEFPRPLPSQNHPQHGPLQGDIR